MHIYGITEDQARDALIAERKLGRIAPHVSFKILRGFTPRGGGQAVEVQLEAYERDRGRRYGNSGAYGRGYDYAATYDEWGFFLQRLYDENPTMKCGSPTRPWYADKGDYMEKTAMSYSADLLETLAVTEDPFPYVAGRNCIGRRGAGRLSASEPRARYWGKPQPRTVEWVRAFQSGEVY